MQAKAKPEMIDLRHYALQTESTAHCSDCEQRMLLLGPRFGYYKKAIYYLCAKCGKIIKAGQKTPIAPAEKGR